MSPGTIRTYANGKCGCREPIEYEPFDDLTPGDVVRWGKRGRLRKVRAVSYCKHDKLRSVTFVKLVRSRYPQATTLFIRQEVRIMFKGIAGKASLCTVPVECQVQADVDAGRSGINAKVTQDEAVGIIY